MPTFQDLKVWQEAIRLMVEVDGLCKKLPREEKFQLIDQVRRSSSSVPDNIAEGYTAIIIKIKFIVFMMQEKNQERHRIIS